MKGLKMKKQIEKSIISPLALTAKKVWCQPNIVAEIINNLI